jgi:hypothetical protein
MSEWRMGNAEWGMGNGECGMGRRSLEIWDHGREASLGAGYFLVVGRSANGLTGTVGADDVADLAMGRYAEPDLAAGVR